MINTISEYIKKKRKKEAEETEIRDQRAAAKQGSMPHAQAPTYHLTTND